MSRKQRARKIGSWRHLAPALARALSLGLAPLEAMEQLGAAAAAWPPWEPGLLEGLSADLRGGKRLAQALEDHSCPRELVRAVQVGERIQDLAPAVAACGPGPEERSGRRDRLLHYLVYQIVVLLLLVLMMPIFLEVLGQIGPDGGEWYAPHARQGAPAGDMGHMIALAHTVHMASTALLALLLGLALGLRLRLHRRLLPHLPGMGGLFSGEQAARVARDLRILLDAGVPVAPALRLSGELGLAAEMEHLARRCENGASLDEALEGSRLARHLLLPTRTAAISGDLSRALEEAASSLEHRSRMRKDQALALLSMATMAATALVVGAALVMLYRLFGGLGGVCLGGW